MYRLLEIVYSDKESAAIYDGYNNETELMADYETKLGQDMKSDAFKAALLVAFDSTGNIYADAYTNKDAEVVLSPRLVWVQTTEQGETADQSKRASITDLEAEQHIKKGAAMRTNSGINSILLIGIPGTGVGKVEFWARPTEPQVEVEE